MLFVKLRDAVVNLVEAAPAIRDATASGNLKVLSNLLGPAFRGLVLKRGKAEPNTVMHAEAPAAFSWDYLRDKPQLARLYEVAKRDQWNATEALDWEQDVDPADPNHPMLPEAFLPMADRPDYQGLSP